MENQELLEHIFKLQDYNKSLRLNATTEEQKEQLDKIDALIDEMLKKIYVHV
jgi:hypothetical protein